MCVDVLNFSYLRVYISECNFIEINLFVYSVFAMSLFLYFHFLFISRFALLLCLAIFSRIYAVERTAFVDVNVVVCLYFSLFAILSNPKKAKAAHFSLQSVSHSRLTLSSSHSLSPSYKRKMKT